MGWFFSLILFFMYWVDGHEAFLIASGLFAIAGSIAFTFSDTKNH